MSFPRERARAAHQTNGTSGRRSSIDKSCKTWEGRNTIDGPQPGAINWALAARIPAFPAATETYPRL